MSAVRASRGFTLVEVMVVMVIVGIILGMVTLNAIPSPRQNLQSEAQRLALLLQLARDEAIVRNRLVTFEANSERYRFLVRNDLVRVPKHPFDAPGSGLATVAPVDSK